ncbi:MAG TPA: succinate dehydrogenase cytochrome b subunit [Marmoricola sp.]
MAISTTGPSLVKNPRATRSTIALKLLMAISGIIFVLFVLLHMYGNLRAFWGETSYNTYAEGLRTFLYPDLPRTGFLWIMRAVLIVSLVVHVYSAATLWRRAKAARPVKYQVKKHTGAIPASRLMRWGGVTLLLFIIWHLLEFTIVKINVGDGGQGDAITHNPYRLLVASFNVWWLTLIYLVAMAMLGAHLHHGIWSSLQTLGLTNSARSRRTAKQFAFALAVIIAGGFSLVPIFIAVGVID